MAMDYMNPLGQAREGILARMGRRRTERAEGPQKNLQQAQIVAGIEKIKRDEKNRQELQTFVTQNQDMDPDKAQLEFWKSRDPEKHAAVAKGILEQGKKLFEFDPEGSTKFLNEKLGLELKYHGKDSGNLIKVEDKTAGQIYFLDPKTADTVRKLDVSEESRLTGEAKNLEEILGRKPSVQELKDLKQKQPTQITTRVLPDGTTEIVQSTGGKAIDSASGLSKKTTKDIEGQLLTSTEKLRRMGGLVRNFRPEFLDKASKFKVSLDNQLEAWGVKDLSPVEKNRMKEFSTYAQDAIQNMNATIKDITGAAMGKDEALRIKMQEPEMGESWWKGDGPTKFFEKLQNSYEKSKLAVARLAYIRNNGFVIDRDRSGNAVKFRGRRGVPIDIDDVPGLINKRGQEIEDEIRAENPDMSVSELDSATDTQLSEEFGL